MLHKNNIVIQHVVFLEPTINNKTLSRWLMKAYAASVYCKIKTYRSLSYKSGPHCVFTTAKILVCTLHKSYFEIVFPALAFRKQSQAQAVFRCFKSNPVAETYRLITVNIMRVVWNVAAGVPVTHRALWITVYISTLIVQLTSIDAYFTS